MHQVIYASAALAPFSEAELTDLLARARINNHRLGVTGLLLYDEGSFLQALEGDAQVLDALFGTIGRDKRHHRVIPLLKREIDARFFADWRMGFASVRGFPKSIPGYSEYLRLRATPLEAGGAAAKLLAAFRDGRFHSFVAS